MPSSFKAISLSHTHAPIDIRELIYLPEAVCKRLVGQMADLLGIRELMIFSTCNRTEVYYVDETDRSEEIIRILCREKGINDPATYLPYFQVIQEEIQAIHYLFEVSMGLHSSILGDLQIANQIKQAYAWAHEGGRAAAFLHRLMHTIFHTNKRVQQETPYRDGAASVSYAAASMVEELTDHLSQPSVMILGLGEMGADVARNLDLDLFHQVHLYNRTFEKAQTLAEEIGTLAIPLEQLKDRLEDYDVIITALSVEQPYLTEEDFSDSRDSSVIVVDLSLPRAVAKEVESFPYVLLYSIDDIRSRTEATLKRRQEAVQQVGQIITEEVTGFLTWRKELTISPIIHKIKEALEQIRKDELTRYLKKASESEMQLLEEATQNMVNKIVKLPVLQLKAACQRGEQEELADVLLELFDPKGKQVPK